MPPTQAAIPILSTNCSKTGLSSFSIYQEYHTFTKLTNRLYKIP
jgi:hypothetical protein